MLFLICSAFVAIGVFLLEEKPFVGWMSICIFGFGVIISLIQFHPNASYLKLNDEGFEVRSLFRSHFTKWSDITNLRPGSMSGNKMIFFDFKDEHKKFSRGKKFSRLLSGNQGAVQSSYNISTEQLFTLMQEYVQK